MPANRRVPSSLNPASNVKRSRLNNKPSVYDCDLCTSNSSKEDLFRMKGFDNGLVVEYQCHLHCIEVIPETHLVATDPSSPKKRVAISNHVNYHWRINELKCAVCDERHGAKIQCTFGQCLRAFHINCAQATEGVTFAVKKDADGLPYSLKCHKHQSGRRESIQDAEIKSRAMGQARLGDKIVVRFPSEGSFEQWILSVNQNEQEITVTPTTESIQNPPENLIFTVKWNAIVVNDLLQQIASRSTAQDSIPPPASATTTRPNRTSTLPTPPPDRLPRPTLEVIDLDDSPAVSVIDLTMDSDEEPAICKNESLDNSTTVPQNSATPIVDSTLLLRIPGLVQAYSDFFSRDPGWNRKFDGIILSNDS